MPVRKNYHVLTFFSKGDYRLMARGGAWIYDGEALLVTPFDTKARPSETLLDAVPVWVRFDIPWKNKTKAYGNSMGGTLGEVLAVDASETGFSTNEFLRVRVKLSYNRCLQKEVTLEYKVKGETERSKSNMKYERIPLFPLQIYVA